MAEFSLTYNSDCPETLIAEGLAEVRLLMDGIEAQRQAEFEQLAVHYNPIKIDQPNTGLLTPQS